jgi:hypothetical protein
MEAGEARIDPIALARFCTVRNLPAEYVVHRPVRRSAGRDHSALGPVGGRGRSSTTGAMTESEARAALRAFHAFGDIEQWIAAQRWEAVSGGWRVRGQLHGRWRFRVLPIAGGVRVVMCGVGGAPADWIVPAR